MTEAKYLQQNLHDRCTEIGYKWAYQLAHSKGLAGIKVSQEQLTGWTRTLINACFEDVKVGETQPATKIGTGLSNLCGGREVGLAKSLATLTGELLAEYPGSTSPLFKARVGAVLGHLTIGFFHGQRLPPGNVSPPFYSDQSIAPISSETTTLSESQLRLENLARIQSLELAAVNQKLHQELMERRQTEDMLRQHNQGLTLVNRVSHSLISTLNLEKVLNIIMVELYKLLPIAAYSVWLIDDDTNQLVCRQATLGHQETMVGWRLDMGQGVAGWVAASNMGVIVHDTRRDDRHFKEIDRALDYEVRSMLSVPVRGREEVVGVLQVVDTRPSQFTTSQLELVESLADAAGIAIENAKLYEQTRQEADHQAVLLREVDHRIKNNLSVLNSMLRLKLGRITPDRLSYEAIIEDVINQIQSLTTVHNLLSASDWGALPVDELARRVIESSLRLLSPGQYVLVEVSPSTVWVAANQAHEMALIINELVTNSVKHALPELSGPLQIEVCVTQDNQLAKFKYRDNGPGYQPETILMNQSHFGLGLELIQQIVVHSLEGQLTIANDNGAVTTIMFENAAEKPAVKVTG
jgi:two-component sensor histidine kinase/putative methionine-R-sulfoxide reductase with GAF domain